MPRFVELVIVFRHVNDCCLLWNTNLCMDKTIWNDIKSVMYNVILLAEHNLILPLNHLYEIHEDIFECNFFRI